VRIIAESRIKTDKADSEALAHLLRLGYLPTSYVPDKPLRELRELARHRTRLGQERSRVKVRIKAELNRRGLDVAKPLSRAGKAQLASLHIPAVDDLLVQLSLLGQQIRRSEGHLAAAVPQHPWIELLQTIPGVGLYTASVAVAELGNITRFPDVVSHDL
jgi:transposase